MGFMAGLATASCLNNQNHAFGKEQKLKKDEVKSEIVHKAHEKPLELSKCSIDCCIEQQLIQKEIEEDREWHKKKPRGLEKNS